MNKLFIIIIASLSMICSPIFLSAQETSKNIEKLDTSINNKKTNEILISLNKQEKAAKRNNDTLQLLLIYDHYIKIFELDTLSDNEKKFYFQKILLLRNYISHNNNIALQTELMHSYIKLADFFVNNKEHFTAINIYKKALLLSKTIKDKRSTAIIHNKIGKVYNRTKYYNDALINYQTSINIARKIPDSGMVINNFIEIANLYVQKSEFSNSIYFYFEALSIAKMSDNLKKKAIIYSELAEVFYKLGYYSISKNYSNLSLKIFNLDKTLFDDEMLYEKYIFIGKNFLKLNNFNDAIENYNSALTIAKKLKNQNYIADTYSLLGNVYTQKEMLPTGYDFLLKSLLIRNKLGDSIGITESKLSIGNHYFQKGDIQQAKFYLINAHKSAIQLKNFDLIAQSSLCLSDIYEAENNYKSALKYYKKHKQILDSIRNKNDLISIEKIEIDQQNKLVNIIEKQELTYLKKRKTELTVLLIELGILLSGFIIIILFFIVKNRTIKKQNSLIEQQKQTILEQSKKYKLLSLVASHTDNSIFILDTNLKFIWVNDFFLSLYDISQKDLFSGENSNLSTYAQQEISAVTKVCISQKQSYTYTTNQKINNKQTWIQTTISPIIENDKIVNLIGIDSDITSLKTAQYEIQQQKKDIEYRNAIMDIYNKELKKQKDAIIVQNDELKQQQEELKVHTDLLEKYNTELQRLSVVASEIDNIVCIFNVMGELVWVNKAFTKYTGYYIEEFTDKFGNNITNISMSDEVNYYFSVCIEQKKSVKYTSKILTKYGKKIWTQTTLSPMVDSKGNVVEIISIDTDIDEIKNAERKILTQHIEITSSLEYASRIQRSVLPLPIFVKAVFEKYFIFNRPRDIVSGDFYFIHYLSNNKVIFALADCTGHGIPGAFMSLLGTMALKIVTNKLKKSITPTRFLNSLNAEIIKLLHQRGSENNTIESIDMGLCIFDFQEETFEYSGANIPLIFSRKDGDNYVLSRIKPTKSTIGYDENFVNFKIHSFKLQTGDRIYLSSDGLADQFGGKLNKKLKRKGFMDLLERLNKTPIGEQEETLDAFVKQWMGVNEQVDDILVIGIEFS